jgi:predicted nucleotidyltransferase
MNLSRKQAELLLLEQAREYKRWTHEFLPLYEHVDIAILFGSILKDEAKANDIDLLLVYDENKNAIINSIVNGARMTRS